jgi:hypothetical protein
MRTHRRFVALILVAPLLSVLHPAAPPGSSATASGSLSASPEVVHVVHEIATRELGLSRPSNLAWSRDLHALLLGAGSRVLRLAPDGRAVATARLRTVPTAGTLAVDPRTRAATYLAGPDVVTYPARSLWQRPSIGSRAPRRLPARDVRGAAYDPDRGLVLLNGSTLVHRGRHGGVVRAPVEGVAGDDLAGLTRWPGQDLLFTYDRDTRLLLGVDRSGHVARRFDLRLVAVRAVTGLAIAPSADRTDHPSTKSLYLADSGDGATSGRVVEVSLAAAVSAAAATVTGSVVRAVRTSTYSPPSPDPSGIAYLPDLDRMVISDGEVDEMSIFKGVNLFETTRTGVQTRNGVSQPWSDEPTGAGYNSVNHHLLVSDDDDREVYDVAAGADGKYGSTDDTVTHFDTAVAGNGDTEDVTYDPVTGSVWTIDGVNREVYRYRPGPDGRLGTSDDVRGQFDVGAYGAQDPEGIAYDSARDTLVVLDDKSQAIYELNRSGSLLNTITTGAANMRAAAGVAVAPGSVDPSVRNYYSVARGVDNNSDPNENDGMLYELAATLPPIGAGGNQPPLVDAGPDQSVTLPASAQLDGTVTDDGLPSPPTLSATWSKVSGFGDVTFGNRNAVDTTASFSADGTYVLRLTVTDGQASGTDDVTVVARPVGSPTPVETSVASGSDDAEQAPSGAVSLTSTDLELVTDGTQVQRVGVRFANVQVPSGAAVSRAWIQFQTDEVSTDAAALTLRAEALDSAPTYQSTSSNISSRPVTSASVAWSPPGWDVVGSRTTAQRTPDLATLVQAVVGRPGWAQGNAIALQITGSGRRTAEASEGTFTPLLHIEYSVGGQPVNRAPSVSAGADQSVVLPQAATLDGTVTDDGLPAGSSLTTTWTQVSGPGAVTFADPGATDTTAGFTQAGTYVLRLTASDSALSGSDEVTVTALAAGTGQTFDVPVRVGADDAEQRATGGVVLTSSDLDLTVDGSTVIGVVGLRFTGVDVPPGAVITVASVQFTADEVGTGASSLTIRAQAADNAGPFVAATNNLSSRATTGAAAAWTVPDWTTVGAAGAAQRTSDLAAVLQEVVGRPGWARGNALVILLTGSAHRVADSFEGKHAPVLHLEWHL